MADDRVSQEIYGKLEPFLHAMQREAVMAIVNNKDFQFGTVLGLQMNLRAVVQLESDLLVKAFGIEAQLKREEKGYAGKPGERGSQGTGSSTGAGSPGGGSQA